MLHQMVQYLPISEQKYCKLIKHMLSTFQAENRGLHKHSQPAAYGSNLLRDVKTQSESNKIACNSGSTDKVFYFQGLGLKMRDF